VALCNDILTGNKRLAIDIMFLEQLFEGNYEAQWAGTEKDDVLDPEFYVFRFRSTRPPTGGNSC
jgi:hypothetical protein